MRDAELHWYEAHGKGVLFGRVSRHAGNDRLEHFKTAEGDAALDAIADAVDERLGGPVPREHRVERNPFAKDKKRIAQGWAEIDPIVEESTV